MTEGITKSELISSQNEMLNSLMDEVAAQDKEIKTLKDEKLVLQTRNQELEQENLTLREEKSTLLGRKLASEQENERLKAEVKRLNIMIQGLEMDASACDCKKTTES